MTSFIDPDWLEDGEFFEAEQEQAKVTLDLSQDEKQWISTTYNYIFGFTKTVAIIDSRATKFMDQGC